MATRKVLINRHTTGNTAPNAAEMYHGEIAVAHETGKETLFTKNNAGNMVPFISCAQTISIVSGMIASVDVVYDVNKKEGEPYINVETGQTGNKKTFTLSTSGVASETNLNSLSSATVSNFQSMTNILSALTDVVVTAITGDEIITATEGPTPATTGSNTYTITHKTGHESTGFNKLATDAYGHVTASTAVTTADIQALGFKTSAETGEDLKALSASVVTNKTNIEALSAGTIQLSGDVVAYVNQISGYAHGEIVELSAATSAVSVDVKNLSAATLDLSAVTLTGVSLNNTPLAVNNHIVSVPVTTSGSGIAGAAAADSGSMASAIAVKEYVEDTLSSAVEYKGATGATPSNPAKGDLYIASSDFVVEGSKSAETGDFIIYDGTKWDVIEKNLDGAITGNLTQDTVTLGDSTNSVKSLANGTAGQVLTIGTAGTPVWADDPVLSTATTGDGNVVSEITVNDHEITYVKNFTAATNADLEIVSGIVDTFSAATVAEFNSAFTAINTLSADAHNSMIARDNAVFSSAVTYVGEQIDEVYASAVSYADSAITVAIEALDSETAVTKDNYITGIAIKDGKISGITQTALPANVVLTATTATPVDTASAVLTGVTAAGTDNHELTFGMSNKVFSATTADSALTSESALTSVSATVAADAVHASAATKVDNALTVSGYSTSSASSLDSAIAYDGHEAKSLTFGTNGPAGLKSMSMTSAGVVDVEVIDCGEY